MKSQAPQFVAELKRLIADRHKDEALGLADAAHLDPGWISRVIRGERQPTPLFVARVARSLLRSNPRRADEVVASYLRDIAVEVYANMGTPVPRRYTARLK